MGVTLSGLAFGIITALHGLMDGHSGYKKIHMVRRETKHTGCFTFLSKQPPESWSISNLNTCGAL